MILQSSLIKNARFEENKEYSVLFTDTLEDGYFDITNSIGGWYYQGAFAGKDYKFVRAKIQGLITGFDTLTATEKLMAAEFMSPDPTTIALSGVLGDEFNASLSQWIYKSKESRIKRWEAVKSAAFGLITEGMKALSDVIIDGLKDKYIEGIESKALDGQVGIFDWVESTDTYISGGLVNNGYTSKDPQYTMSDISVILMDIIKNGNY